MGVVPRTSTIYEVLEELAIAVQARPRPALNAFSAGTGCVIMPTWLSRPCRRTVLLLAGCPCPRPSSWFLEYVRLHNGVAKL